MLQGYSWPGNVRELQNVMMSAALASDGLEIEAADLPAWIAYSPGHRAGNSVPPAPVEDDPMLSFREIERRAIVRAVKMAGGNVERAAKVLGLSRSTLYRRMGALVLDTSAKP